MKLQNSKLCVNCECLYEGIGPCPDCASEVFLWAFQGLGTALERKEPETNHHESAMENGISSQLADPVIFSGMTIPRGGSSAATSNIFNKLGQGIARILALVTT